MSTLAEIYAKQDWWDARRQRALARQRVAERTVDRCYAHLGVTTMVEQLRDLLAPHFPDHDLRVLGPFGLTNETAIHANDPSHTDRFIPMGSISFRPDGNNRLNLVDYSHDTGQFARDSLGGMNGMNHPEVPVDNVEGLIDVLRASIARKRR